MILNIDTKSAKAPLDQTAWSSMKLDSGLGRLRTPVQMETILLAALGRTKFVSHADILYTQMN
jgi:hypothetical protein